MMISKILVAISATKDGAVSMLDAFQIIQKDRPSVKVLFTSYLSDLFKKSLGPNTLNHWVEEEKECMEKVSNYFARMDIPYEPKVIIVPPWEIVFHEMSDEVKDLIILHSELLKKWRKNKASCTLCSELISQLKCPILVIDQPENLSDLKPF